MSRTSFRRIILLFVLCWMPVLLNACAQLKSILSATGVQYEKPALDFANAKLDKLSFENIDFLFDFKIKNPNPIQIKMAGFDYDFLINDNSFVQGKKDDTLEIASKGESTVQLPISLNFVNLYNTFKSLKENDESNYQMNLGMTFDVPVLGNMRIPISKGGKFPLLKLPTVGIGTLKLNKMDWTSAELALDVNINNPNAFTMLLEKFSYGLKINNQSWVTGKSQKSLNINEKGKGKVQIPIKLDFLEMGKTVVNLLSGNTTLNYQFDGIMDLKSSLELLGKVSLPFDTSGKINLAK